MFRVANIRRKNVAVKKKMDLFSKKSMYVSKKNILLQRFLSLRPVAMQMAASKRFHKFWFLVLENPGFGWDFLVIGLGQMKNPYLDFQQVRGLFGSP